MTDARIGWGGRLYVSTDNTEANLAEVSEVRECGFPQDETEESDATHLRSPGKRREFVSGLIDGGEFTATLNYVPGSASDLLLTGAKETGTTRKIRIVIPDESGTGAADWNIVTSAFVKRYAPDNMTPGEVITATATFRVTGDQEQGTGAAGS
jgi:hypothetical protein